MSGKGRDIETGRGRTVVREGRGERRGTYKAAARSLCCSTCERALRCPEPLEAP